MKSVRERQEVAPKAESGPFNRPCFAFGCQELGTISPSTAGPMSDALWFCRWHWCETADNWPEITRQRRLASDMRLPAPLDQRVEVTPEYIAKARAELRQLCGSFGLAKDPKAWARKLRDRELRGEQLGYMQAKLWRDVLGEDEAALEARLEREAIQAEGL